MSLDPALRARIDALVGDAPVLLFMKGDRRRPQCGFSARVVGVLDGLLDDYSTVDILADDALRAGMKAYADWPTFPQLWVRGELVGGCDIVEQLDRSGELQALLGISHAPTPPPRVHVSAAAIAHIVAALGEPAPRLRVRVSRDFTYGFEAVDAPGAGDVAVEAGPLTLVFDRASARRADGLALDVADRGGRTQLVVDNPQEPPRVRPLSVDQLAGWQANGTPHALIDVRTPEEVQIARIAGARLLDADALAHLEALPRDTTLVFQCHHGTRSQRAAEHFLGLGFTRVYNLTGGIDAWSLRIDPSVPRY